MSVEDKCPHGERMGASFCHECNPTLMKMIEEMPNTHICRGGHNIWWAYIEPWGVYEDGKGGSPFDAVRALYEKWKVDGRKGSASRDAVKEGLAGVLPWATP